jgi:hypothetical protein
MPMDDHAGILGPAIVLAAIALLGLALRLMMGRDNGTGRGAGFGAGIDAGFGGARRGPAREDFGLLRVAALADDRGGALVVCGLLAGAGIRATIAPETGGMVRVLVFAADLERARTVVSGPPA